MSLLAQTATDELGRQLTLVGAIRRRGWVVLNTYWGAMDKLPSLAGSAVGSLPDCAVRISLCWTILSAHKAGEVRCLIERRGGRLKLLPPYPHDFNPIEPVWGLVKTW